MLVVERARLVQEASAARAFAESDRLKSVLLASISHDLRTPLALIKGAVTNAAAVIEMTGGSAAHIDIRPGDQLDFRPASPE